MSWSFSAIGNVEPLCKALDADAAKQTGQCKIEMDAAVPHLKALIRENFQNQKQYGEPLIDIEASGSGTGNSQGEQFNRSCSVKISAHWKKLCF